MNSTTPTPTPTPFTSLSLISVNNTSSVLQHSDRSSQVLGWFIAVLLFNGFGIVANTILLCTMFVYEPLRRSSSRALIIHCLAIDLYLTAAGNPFWAVPQFLGPSYHFSLSPCRFQPFFIFVFYMGSMYAYANLALHRLIATVLPQNFALASRRPVIAGLILSPWVFAIVINIFPTIEWGFMMVRNNKSGACDSVPTGVSMLPLLVYSVMGVYVPTAITGSCYIVVLTKTAYDMYRKVNQRTVRRRLDISRTLFCSFIWHCITIYGPNIVLFVQSTGTQGDFLLQLGMYWLAMNFSAVNPVFFWASSRLFQDGIKKVLSCRWSTIAADPAVQAVGTSGQPPTLVQLDGVLSSNAPHTNKSRTYGIGPS